MGGRRAVGKQASGFWGAGGRGLTAVAATETPRRGDRKGCRADDPSWVTGRVPGTGGTRSLADPVFHRLFAGQPGGGARTPHRTNAAAEGRCGGSGVLGAREAPGPNRLAPTPRSGTDSLRCGPGPTRARRSRPGTGPSTSPTASNLAREPDVARRATSPWRRRTAGLFHARAGTLPGGWPSGAVPASLSLLSRVSRSGADGGRGRKGQAPADSEVTPCRRERPGDAPAGERAGSAGRDAVGLHGNSMAHRAPGRKRQSFQKGVQLSRFTPISAPTEAHTCPRLDPSTALHSGPACHPPWRGASKVSRDSR